MATLFLKSRSGPPPASSKAPLPDTLRFARRVALLLILLSAWYLRAHDPRYASAFMDESIYVLYGRMFLSHQFEAPLDEPLHWSFGWYLWPAMAATADRLGGLVGLREMSAVLGMLAVLALYGFARRVFSPAVGLASAAVFALLGPAVFAFRIATRDAGALFFFAVGLWFFARAWQEEDSRSAGWLAPTRSGLAAAVFFFAAFLCKYLVALYFPFLVLIGLRRWRQSVLAFALPLALLCAIYGGIYYNDLAYLLSYGRGYGSLAAPANEAWKIYVAQRVDFWVLLALSFFAWRHRASVSLWLGAAVMLAFQWFSRADYDYWKHVNYSLLFLVPLAMEGLLRLTRRLGSLLAPRSTPVAFGSPREERQISGGRGFNPAASGVPPIPPPRASAPEACLREVSAKTSGLYPALTIGAVLLLAVSLGWAGNAWRIERFIFWPNVEPIAAYFEGRLGTGQHVLVDDSVLRYYFSPPLRQNQITDPFYFGYHGATGEAAYAAAVRDGYFDYVVLDGGMGEEARRMQAAIGPALRDAGGYELCMSMPDPVLHQKIEIYERRSSAGLPAGIPQSGIGEPGFQPRPDSSGPATSVPSSSPRVEILTPASNSIVQTSNKSARLQGIAFGAKPGWYVRAEVFTNRWYPQGRNKIPLASDGSFSEPIYLAGEGTEQCYHLVRVRLYDEQDSLKATAVHYGVARANPDGSAPSCR